MELSVIKAWKKNEPECYLVIFNEAGPCVNMDMPQQFNATMEKFWTKKEV